MRFRSENVKGFRVFAVSGVNTVSFGIAASKQAREGLLGFAVERVDAEERERYFMKGYKVFRSVIAKPDENTAVSTWEHPIQSFVWDDFTAKPDHRYEYRFYPLLGSPKNLDRHLPPVPITVRTEPLFSDLSHDVFFNRGVASSQAYAQRFHNEPPDRLPEPQAKLAFDWLARDLDHAILKFIEQARKGDTLLCCFYEFSFAPVLAALKAAIDRGADVRIILDAKENGTTGKDGKVQEAFPRESNLRAAAAAGIPRARLVLREARRSAIAHNKFMVHLRGKGEAAKPAAVWTGSTNISLNGVSGQTNVGHWVRDADVAQRYRAYWDLLAEDPGATTGDDVKEAKAKNAALRKAVEELSPAPAKLADLGAGVTPIFSPRSGLSVLDLYFGLVDEADSAACITLAFGISARFKALLQDNTPQQAIVFMLLEQEDRPKKGAEGTFVAINASNNVYKAWGAFLHDPVARWVKETSTKQMGIAAHVAFIHSKFLLRDPLGKDPIVVTGSANFSEASTKENDENMLMIRGDRRVADIYFSEFNRLFNHYYFRSVYEKVKEEGHQDDSELFLKEKAKDWLVKYDPGTLRTKRVKMFAEMEGFTDE